MLLRPCDSAARGTAAGSPGGGGLRKLAALEPAQLVFSAALQWVVVHVLLPVASPNFQGN